MVRDRDRDITHHHRQNRPDLGKNDFILFFPVKVDLNGEK